MSLTEKEPHAITCYWTGPILNQLKHIKYWTVDADDKRLIIILNKKPHVLLFENEDTFHKKEVKTSTKALREK